MESFIGLFMNLFVFIAPFVILYFVITLAVRKGIDTSEAGRAFIEKHYERKMNKK